MKNLRVKVNGIELQVHDYEHAGEAIIFLHFGGGNLMMWQRAIPYFQPEYRLVLVDLRGHGKSDRPETGHRIDEMAWDVAVLMEQLELRHAHVIGSSLGAEVGLSLAAHAPAKVLSLACDGALYSEYGPYGIWERSKAEFREYVTATLEKMRNAPEQSFPSIEAFVDAKRHALGEWWNDSVDALVRYDARLLGAGYFGSAWGKAAKLDYMQSYFACQFEVYYRQVKCPLLMLSDEEDQQNERMAAAMQGLCRLTPQGRIVTVPGWIHPYGWLLDPDGICKTILEFLAEIRG